MKPHPRLKLVPAVLGITLVIPAASQAEGSGSSVVLPGGDIVAGASSRYSPFPERPGTWRPPTPPSVPVMPTSPVTTAPVSPPTTGDLASRSSQLEQRLTALGSMAEGSMEEDTFDPGRLFSGSPGIGTNTPTAYGASGGTAGIGFGYQNKTFFTENSDTQLMGVVGFGNPRKNVGLKVGLNILDLSDFGDNGSFNFLVHRQFPSDFAVGVGVENVLDWGNAQDTPTSTFGVITKMLRLKQDQRESLSRLDVSLGVGGGRFRRDADLASIGLRPERSGVGVFGSVALKVAQPVNVFAEWTGNNLNVGASITPFRKIPLVIVPALADINHHADGGTPFTRGSGTRFTLGIGYGFTY